MIKHITPWLARLTIGLVCVLPQFTQAADPEFVFGQNYQAVNPAELTLMGEAVAATHSPTGAFTYTFDLTIPAGRNGLQPQLQLNYNSQGLDPESWLSVGWSLSVPSITRMNKTGIDEMYTSTNFSSSLSGELEAVSLSSEQYGTYQTEREDGSFYNYTYNTDGSWTAVDKQGLTYTFGLDTDSRLDNPDDTTQIYRWYLTTLTDQHGNTVTYTYDKDQNQVYPQTISYANRTIEFTLTSRDDQLIQFDTGFEVRGYYLIDTITTTVDGAWVRQYDLDYTKPDTRERMVLSSLTESGQADDGTITTLPANSFTYQTSTGGWTEDTSYSLPTQFTTTGSDSQQHDSGVRMFDANGDHLPDFIYSSEDGTSVTSAVYLHTGSGWLQDTAYTVPVGFIRPSTPSGVDLGVRILDVNGDGLQDLVRGCDGSSNCSASSDGVYLNDPDAKTWTYSSSFSLPFDIIAQFNGLMYDAGLRFGDVNGDRLPDILYALESNSGIYESTDLVYINTGSGWTQDASYVIPISMSRQLSGSASYDVGVALHDVNGDGLVDLLKAFSDNFGSDYGVYINQGNDKTWVEDTSYGLDANTAILDYSGASPYDSGWRFFDVNGDQFVDQVYSVTGYANVYEDVFSVQLHGTDTTGWSEVDDADYTIPTGIIQQGSGSGPSATNLDEGVRFSDIDGDGMTDMIKSNSVDSDNGVYLNTAEPVDLLMNITLATGATITASYDVPSASDNPELAYPLRVVDSVVKDDGLGNTSTTSYSYAGGEHYFETYDRQKFGGFSTITETTADRIATYHYDQTDWYTIGLLTEVSVSDTTGTPFATVTTTWEDDDHFVYPTQQVQLLYSSDGSSIETAESYNYDLTTGNRTELVQSGAADTSSDDLTTTWSFATDSSGEIRSAVSQQLVTDSTGTTLQDTQYYYDDLAWGEVTTGDLTQQQTWISGSDYATTSYAYTTSGLRSGETNDNSITTSYTYDSTELQPTTMTDGLGYTTNYTYTTAGSIATVTDANGVITEYTYDGLNRPLTKVLDGVTTETKSYDDSSAPRGQQTTLYLSASETVTTNQYVDGWDRAIQERVSTETAGSYVVTALSYNAAGLVDTATQPYTGSGSSYATITSDNDYLLTHTYDALRRRTGFTSPLGTANYDYSGRTITATDTLGQSTAYTYDGFDRLITVNEDPAGIAASTSYTRDALGRITTITDADGRLSNYSYDAPGHLLTKTLNHASTATTTYGWTYTYDGVGNQLTVLTPQGSTISTTYDGLNRPTLVDQDTDITYTYDSCSYGIGRLCEAAIAGGTTTSYTYDSHGNQASETQTVAGTAYTTSYTYTYQDQLSTVTYLDGSQLLYDWNDGGYIETVTYDPPTGASSVLVSNIDYEANRKPSSLTYLNGATTSYTYDPAQLYALTNQTTTRSGSNVQTLDYTYDAGLNLTGRSLTSDSLSAVTSSFGFDALNRLTSGTINTTSLSYAYSDAGNLTSDAALGTYTYDTAHPQAVKKAGTKRYTYDAAGNTLTFSGWTYTWNNQQQMSGARNSARTLEFSYDYQGNRVRRNNVTTGVYLNTINPYLDVTASQYHKHVQIPGIGNVVTVLTNRSTSRSYMMYHVLDYQQSHTVNINSSGTITQAMDYYPFGSRRSNTVVNYSDNYTFTGEMYDSDSGLQYLGARYYTPAISRMLSQDPWEGDYFRPQTLNKYSYGLNNPLRYTDPSGAVTYDTLKTGIHQMAVGLMGGGEMFVKAFTAGTLAGTGHTNLATIRAGGAIADFDDALVNFTNGFNNTINAFQDQSAETIITQGPYRDLAEHIPGMDAALTTMQTGSEFTGIATTPTSLGQEVIREFGLITGSYDAITSDIVETPATTQSQVNTSTTQTNTTQSLGYYGDTSISSPDTSSWYSRIQTVVNNLKNK